MAAVEDMHGISLPSRYEIRKLNPEHEVWYRALMVHGMLLRAPVWRPVIPKPEVKTLLQAFDTLRLYYAHTFQNGLSYAIYDKEYVFKRPESAATNGALYWHEIDVEDPDLEEKGEQWMLEKMDFPIIALALSYDLVEPPPRESMGVMATLAPLWGQMMAKYAEAILGNTGFMPQPTGAGQYIHRSGQVTRLDYEGRGLGKLFSWWVMYEMASKGYRGILVGAGNFTITRIWLHSDAPFESTAILQQDMEELEVEFEGEKVSPYVGAGLKDFNYLLCDLSNRKASSKE